MRAGLISLTVRPRSLRCGKPGELEIVEAEAEIVRRIFTEYVDGKSPRDIAHDLNKVGIALQFAGIAAMGHSVTPLRLRKDAAPPYLVRSLLSLVRY